MHPFGIEPKPVERESARPVVWVWWRARGRESVQHAAHIERQDVRNGGFPLLCGKWAPDGFDADLFPSMTSGGRRCKRCVEAVEA
jgi:hypothetical protein